MKVSLNIIGTIYSPFKELKNMPIQPCGAKNIEGEIVINEQYTDGLTDLAGFSHIYLLYHLHMVDDVRLKVIPFMDTKEHGIFATRSPLRPAPIGLSIVKLVERQGNKLRILGVDVLDGTPLIDIKPYIPQVDHQENATCGWLKKSKKEVAEMRSDGRFSSSKIKS